MVRGVQIPTSNRQQGDLLTLVAVLILIICV
jgi:hypothetical protein